MQCHDYKRCCVPFSKPAWNHISRAFHFQEGSSSGAQGSVAGAGTGAGAQILDRKRLQVRNKSVIKGGHSVRHILFYKRSSIEEFYVFGHIPKLRQI